MKNLLPFLCLLILLASCQSTPPTTQSEPDPWTLVWSDEFDGTEVDTTKWSFQIGNGGPKLPGWGNGEMQYYTRENSKVENGNLVIEAKKEPIQGFNYSASRLRTKDKGDFTYGKFEARMKLPKGQGIWPAFWMLPTDQKYGTWAASGEIDIMEMRGHIPNRILGTLHYGAEWPNNVFSGDSLELPDIDYSEDFHTFGVEWEENEIRWYIDSNLFCTRNAATMKPKEPWPFDQRFHIILNLAVGGKFVGPPDATTIFPQEMVVDYVRVYEKSSSSKP